jgi:hypothetical protein
MMASGMAKEIQDEHDDLHVHITGENEEDVEKAAKVVADMLVPIDDAVNPHKMKVCVCVCVCICL